MKNPFLGHFSFKRWTCKIVIASLISFTSLLGQAVKTDLLPKGFNLNPAGKIVAIDSLVPSYFMHYGAGATLRGGLENTPQIREALSYYIQIPVLVSEKITKEQALANFVRSIKFNSSGIDPAGGYSNGAEKGGNVSLNNEMLKKFLEKEGGIEELFNYQLKAGNYLVVDVQTLLPLFRPSGKEDSDHELKLFRKTLVHWAAAYPWAFYELQNIALKEAILQNRDLYPLSLFIKHRFQFDEEFLQQVNSRMWIANN